MVVVVVPVSVVSSAPLQPVRIAPATKRAIKAAKILFMFEWFSNVTRLVNKRATVQSLHKFI